MTTWLPPLHRLFTLLLPLAAYAGLGTGFPAMATDLSAAEKRYLAEARQDLEQALSDPALSAGLRKELVSRSARTFKEYGRAPAFPEGAIPLERLYRENYKQARAALAFTNELYHRFSDRMKDDRLSLINSLQIQVVEEQIQFTLPGSAPVSLSKDLINTVFDLNLTDGVHGGARASASALAERFHQLARNNRLERQLRLLQEEQLATTRRLHEDLRSVKTLRETLQKRYDTAYTSAFAFPGFEHGGPSGTPPRPERGGDTPASSSRCTCEDWDGDGRFGVVLNGKAIASNIGSRAACQQHAAGLERCHAEEPSTPRPEEPGRNICTCEDWDEDGRFGVVLDGRAIASNVGSYSECMRRAATIDRCHRTDKHEASPPAGAGTACSCADWDNDGRYGVVHDGKAIAPNVGTPAECRRRAAGMSQCNP